MSALFSNVNLDKETTPGEASPAATGNPSTADKAVTPTTSMTSLNGLISAAKERGPVSYKRRQVKTEPQQQQWNQQQTQQHQKQQQQHQHNDEPLAMILNRADFGLNQSQQQRQQQQQQALQHP